MPWLFIENIFERKGLTGLSPIIPWSLFLQIGYLMEGGDYN
jgi:hypothetical protein